MKFFTLLLFIMVLGLTACKSTPDRPEAILDPETVEINQSTPAPITANPAAPANNLPHWYCTNSCEGSGADAQGNCPVCGTAYLHNAAFHNQAPAGTNPATPVTPPVTPPSPAQNANGVYHYTCGNGCSGGAGAQGNCASCGGALAHNDAYHN